MSQFFIAILYGEYTEMGILIFFDFGIGMIGFFCFTFRYRYFTVFRYFGKMSVPITNFFGHKFRDCPPLSVLLLVAALEIDMAPQAQ